MFFQNFHTFSFLIGVSYAHFLPITPLFSIDSLTGLQPHMTDTNIRKSIKRIKINTDHKKRKYTPVILSDSKGEYVKQEICNPEALNIQFINRKGSTLTDSVLFIRNHLHKRIKRFKHVHIYVWLGTCDITLKQGKYIDLRYEKKDTQKLLNRIKHRYEDVIYALQHLKKKHPPKITLLEVPHYSISLYNASKGHTNPQSFYKKDLVLAKQIDQVNQIISELNKGLEGHSPKFSLDLTRPTKGHRGKKSKYKVQRARSHYNFNNVYIDGLHPNPLLSKLWYHRIGVQIVRDCFVDKKIRKHRHHKHK